MSKVTLPREMLLYQSLKGLHLLEKTDKITVLKDLIGIQSQFSGYAEISLRIRANDYEKEDWREGIVKIWSHRGTVHLVPKETLPLHLSAAGYEKEFTDGAWEIGKEDAEKWAAFIVSRIRDGITSREDLKAACREAGINDALLERVFYGWGGLIYEMTYRGMIAGVPGNAKEYLIPEIREPWPEKDAAREEMVRIYFEHFGPATTADCKYFFGRWSTAEINEILKKVLPEFYVTVIDGVKYYSKEKPTWEGEIPDCVLVPGFDQLVLGYKNRDRIIAKEHLGKLTNIAGIIFPSVIIRNRIRAKWKLEKDRVTVTPFEKLYKKDEAAVRKKVKAVFGKKTAIAFCEIEE